MSEKTTKKTGPLAFLGSLKVELNLVKWPTHQATLRMTAVVILVSLLFGIYLGGLDYLFTNLLQNLIK